MRGTHWFKRQCNCAPLKLPETFSEEEIPHADVLLWDEPTELEKTAMADKDTPAPDNDVSTGSEDDVLRAAGKRALEAERLQNTQRQAKIEELQAKLDEIEASKLSEAEKWKTKYEAEKAKAEKLETKSRLDAARKDIAETAGIPDYADLLVGNDEAEMTAFAEKLAAKVGTQKPAPNPFLDQENNGEGDSDAQARQILLGL